MLNDKGWHFHNKPVLQYCPPKVTPSYRLSDVRKVDRDRAPPASDFHFHQKLNAGKEIRTEGLLLFRPDQPVLTISVISESGTDIVRS